MVISVTTVQHLATIWFPNILRTSNIKCNSVSGTSERRAVFTIHEKADLNCQGILLLELSMFLNEEL